MANANNVESALATPRNHALEDYERDFADKFIRTSQVPS
jgi:hypothetical protein